jgi:hypothetical protein
MSNTERPILNVEVGKLDPSVSRHTSLGFYLPATGGLGLFLLFFNCIILYSPLRLSAFKRSFNLAKTRSLPAAAGRPQRKQLREV